MFNVRNYCGAHASGWLERRTGTYLMNKVGGDFQSRREITAQLAGLSIEPNGFEDSGRFIF